MPVPVAAMLSRRTEPSSCTDSFLPYTTPCAMGVTTCARVAELSGSGNFVGIVSKLDLPDGVTMELRSSYIYFTLEKDDDG